jgi:hypothetical protein
MWRTNQTNSGPSVRQRTVPTERPPLVGEVSANFGTSNFSTPNGSLSWRYIIFFSSKAAGNILVYLTFLVAPTSGPWSRHPRNYFP